MAAGVRLPQPPMPAGAICRVTEWPRSRNCMEVTLLPGCAAATVPAHQLLSVADKRGWQPLSFDLMHAGYIQFWKLISFF